MKRWKNICKTCILLTCAVVLSAGCSVKDFMTSGMSGIREYGKPETMVILTTEKLRYEALYTDQIWSAEIDQEGTAFEQELLSQVHDFLRELKLMSHMAEEKEVALTSQEKESARIAAAQYMEALGAMQAEDFGLELIDMENLYQDYWKAEKLVDELTGDMDLEVSVSEAKVITVSEIALPDCETAEEVLLKVQEENADFSGIAKEYTELGAVQKQIYYGLMGEKYEQTAFSLETGGISDVIEENGIFYILKCICDYDVDATRIHKEEMMRQKKNDSFFTTYQTYKAEKPLIEDEDLWKTLSIHGCPNVSADFFALYDAVREERE